MLQNIERGEHATIEIKNREMQWRESLKDGNVKVKQS